MILGVFLLVLLLVFTIVIVVGHRNNEADWGNKATNVLDGLIRIYCRKYHRQSNQIIHIPQQKKILLVANHLSMIDPFILITASRRPIRFMIAKEEYERPILNWMFRAAGCIPVDRSGRVDGAFRCALRALENGEIVGVFPQGGIHKESIPRKMIKSGIIRLSQLSECSILPVRIRGIGAPGTEGLSIITRSNITLNIHTLIRFEKVQDKSFRGAISEWFLVDRENIFEKNTDY